MKRRRPGRPTKVVTASVSETITVGKPGVTFEVWDKWKRKRRKVGTLTVSVGGPPLVAARFAELPPADVEPGRGVARVEWTAH